jgi:DNA repair protein RadC
MMTLAPTFPLTLPYQTDISAFVETLSDIVSRKKVEMAIKLYEPKAILRMSLLDLQGVGFTKIEATRIIAACRLVGSVPVETKGINSPSDAYEQMLPHFQGQEKERLGVLLLDRRSNMIGFQMIYEGTICSSSIRSVEVFVSAVRNFATTIILGHNHPSGDPTPSPDDVAMTRGIAQAGKLLDIEVQDHLVFGLGRYISLKERGLGF